MLCLTPSKLKQYLECGLKFKFQQEDRTPFGSTPATAFGSFIHKALEKVYQNPQRLRDLTSVLRSVWNDSVFESRSDSNSYFTRGLSALERYREEYFSPEGEPLCGKTIGTEAFLAHVLTRDGLDVRYSCKLDRLTLTEDGTLQIVDYKTGHGIPTEDSLQKDLPTFISYGLAKIEYPEHPRIRLKYINVENLKSSEVEYSREQVAINKAALLAEVKKLAAGVFEPKVGEACSWCPYKERCPKMNRTTDFDSAF